MATTNTDLFLQVLNAHKRIIYKVISIYCTDTDDRKDIEQEVVIQLWKSFENYNPKYKYSTWIYKISMNVAISFYRSKTQQRSKTTTLTASIFEETPNPETHENEKSLLLHRLIRQLNEFDKEILVLYLEEYSHKEIAEMLGISISNVATKLSRIKGKLKQISITQK
jgi:RNA polymerase sigma factor (sigma-70 family)